MGTHEGSTFFLPGVRKSLYGSRFDGTGGAGQKGEGGRERQGELELWRGCAYVENETSIMKQKNSQGSKQKSDRDGSTF